MKRHELEHLIGAAANVVGENAFVVIGSQAILATHPNAPEGLLQSTEADLYPKDDPGKAEQIDGALGEGSRFQAAYGYYAHGVGPETVTAPRGWEGRLIPMSVPVRPGSSQEQELTAYCLEVHDLVLAKCAAGRDRDWEYAEEAIRSGLVDAHILYERLTDMPVPESHHKLIRAKLQAAIDRS